MATVSIPWIVSFSQSLLSRKNYFRDDIWSHSQFAQNKVKKRKITRKAGGEVVEEVEEIEEEEEE